MSLTLTEGVDRGGGDVEEEGWMWAVERSGGGLEASTDRGEGSVSTGDA